MNRSGMRASRSMLLLTLGGCAALGPPDGTGDATGTDPIPEAVLAMAAPYQNLGAIEFRPEDGCYWYWHDGPVETTLLPLRTPQGNPICRAST